MKELIDRLEIVKALVSRTLTTAEGIHHDRLVEIPGRITRTIVQLDMAYDEIDKIIDNMAEKLNREIK